MAWSPANLQHDVDGATWDYTNRDRHFWPPDGLVPDDASLIVDVGANAGLSTGLLADAWPLARVIGIEMDWETAERARSNLSGFGTRVEIIVAAVGWPEREDTATFPKASAVNALKKYFWESGNERQVQVISLDNALKMAGITNQTIDFMKVDIEGSEWELIDDGGNWSNIANVVSFEVHGFDREGIDFVNGLEIRGYKIIRTPKGQTVGYK